MTRPRLLTLMWRVIGADASTGRDIHARIDAMDAEEAEKIARDQGILVSEVTPILDYGQRKSAVRAAARAVRAMLPEIWEFIRGLSMVALVVSTIIVAIALPYEGPMVGICMSVAACSFIMIGFAVNRLPKLNGYGLTTLESLLWLYFIVIGFILVMKIPTAPDAPSGLSLMLSPPPKDRFKDDNAYGASANALERLLALEQHREETIRNAVQAICGAILWILAFLLRLRGTIRLQNAKGSIPQALEIKE